MEKRSIEIMDTTLRDGEQMPGSSYPPEWKLRIAQALFAAGVDRVEVASARGFSTKESTMLGAVMKWAEEKGLSDKIEVLTFVDGEASVDWVRKAGGKSINLLCKGSKRHSKIQLKKNVLEHLEDIKTTVNHAFRRGIRTVNVYLEDWSQGMIDSPDYVFTLLEGIQLLGVSRVMLCDTMGALPFWKISEYVGEMTSRFPGFHFDFHGHNDYGLAVANSLAAVRAGACGVHVTVNGLGERTGNAPLDEMAVNVKDHLGDRFAIRIDERALRPLSRTVALMTGRRVTANKPISGRDVFSNTAGIHADGDRKGGLYEHPKLKPQRFGASLKHPMGKLSGKANILQNLETLGWQLAHSEVELILQEVVRLSEEGKSVTIADLPYIVASVLDRPEHVVFEVVDAQSHTNKKGKAITSAKVRFLGEEYDIYSQGNGGFDAFMKALRKLPGKVSDIVVPKLMDYNVQIPPGGGTDALTEVVIEWEAATMEGMFQTRGYNEDQVLASFSAAEAAMNLCNCVRPNGG